MLTQERFGGQTISQQRGNIYRGKRTNFQIGLPESQSYRGLRQWQTRKGFSACYSLANRGPASSDHHKLLPRVYTSAYESGFLRNWTIWWGRMIINRKAAERLFHSEKLKSIKISFGGKKEEGAQVHNNPQSVASPLHRGNCFTAQKGKEKDFYRP